MFHIHHTFNAFPMRVTLCPKEISDWEKSEIIPILPVRLTLFTIRKNSAHSISKNKIEICVAVIDFRTLYRNFAFFLSRSTDFVTMQRRVRIAEEV